MSFGYQVLGFGVGVSKPSATVNVSDMASSSDLGIWAVGGDWVYEDSETNSQSGTATNWIMMNAPYNTNYYSTTPISYDLSDHSVSELASDWQHYNLGGASHSGSGGQLSLDRSIWGIRSFADSISARYYFADLADNLESFTNNINTVTVVQRYGGGYRLSDTQGFYHAQSNASVLIGIGTYSGGSSTTLSATSSEGNDRYSIGFGKPGGSGTSGYANIGVANSVFWMNDNDTQTWNASTTNIDLNHASWNGSAGAALSITANNGAITLPDHTGSTLTPRVLTTSWGNVVIHSDSANPGNAVVFPVTWSGGSASVGSSVAWNGGTSIPANECYFKELSGVGAGGIHHKYMCGQDRGGVADLYRTVRIYASGSDMLVDTITIDFSSSDGSHTVTSKQTAVTTFSSSSSADIWPIFMKNNTDLGIWHKDTGKFHYIENAYF